MTWTDERKEVAKTMWVAGHSGTQIAVALGITRAAAMGQVHRMGLCGRARQQPLRYVSVARANPSLPRALAPAQYTGQSKPKRKRRAPPTPATFERAKLNYAAAAIAATSPPHADEAPPAKTCTLLELTADTCRWPLGTPGTPGFCFCGGKPLASLPYCAPHARLSYTAAVRLTQEERHLRQEQARREARKLAAEAA